jgi:hypothetical protein
MGVNKMMMKNLMIGTFALLGFSGCATYQYAKDVRLVSFEDNVGKGKSVGPIQGEDCVWSVLGYKLGGIPTLDKAFASARNQTSSGITDSFSHGDQVASNDKAIRYINNVSTSYDGFNAVVVGKQCLIVKGTGYR